MSCKTLNGCVGCTIIPLVVWKCLLPVGHSIHDFCILNASNTLPLHANKCPVRLWNALPSVWISAVVDGSSPTSFHYFLSTPPSTWIWSPCLLTYPVHMQKSMETILTKFPVDFKLLSAHRIWLFNSLTCRSFILHLNHFDDPHNTTPPHSSLPSGFLAGSSSSSTLGIVVP